MTDTALDIHLKTKSHTIDLKWLHERRLRKSYALHVDLGKKEYEESHVLYIDP